MSIAETHTDMHPLWELPKHPWPSSRVLDLGPTKTATNTSAKGDGTLPGEKFFRELDIDPIFILLAKYVRDGCQDWLSPCFYVVLIKMVL